MAEQKASRVQLRGMGLIKTAPKAIAWAWERGIKPGRGRNPDYHIYNESDLAAFAESDWIVIRANGPWVGGAPGRK